MTGTILIAAAFVCCASGFVLNRIYAKKYGEAAVQWKLFALQAICIGGALTQLPVDERSFQFLFWLIASVVSCAAGLCLCRQHAKRQQAGPGDTVVAMAAQAILPVGAAVVILMAAGMIAFGFLWVH
ncbi:MAG: hypothetical protein IJG43_05945 [Acidaminococcaceae bacterium]|nr:hypothetical protein [Acidaminococcaceae bacterium]